MKALGLRHLRLPRILGLLVCLLWIFARVSVGPVYSATTTPFDPEKSGHLIYVDGPKFEDLLLENKKKGISLFVATLSDRCVHCLKAFPHIVKLANIVNPITEQPPMVKVLAINGRENMGFMEKYKVQYFPCFLLFGVGGSFETPEVYRGEATTSNLLGFLNSKFYIPFDAEGSPIPPVEISDAHKEIIKEAIKMTSAAELGPFLEKIRKDASAADADGFTNEVALSIIHKLFSVVLSKIGTKSPVQSLEEAKANILKTLELDKKNGVVSVGSDLAKRRAQMLYTVKFIISAYKSSKTGESIANQGDDDHQEAGSTKQGASFQAGDI